MVTFPAKTRNTSSISCLCQTNSPLAFTSLNCQPFASAMILGDQCSVKRPNFCAMWTGPRPPSAGTAWGCSVMIVSLFDEAFGDFADASLRPTTSDPGSHPGGREMAVGCGPDGPRWSDLPALLRTRPRMRPSRPVLGCVRGFGRRGEVDREFVC